MGNVLWDSKEAQINFWSAEDIRNCIHIFIHQVNMAINKKPKNLEWIGETLFPHPSRLNHIQHM